MRSFWTIFFRLNELKILDLKSQKIAEFMEIKRKFRRFKTKYHTIGKHNEESKSTLTKIGQNALIQSGVFEQAIKRMGDTIEDIDIEIEQKDERKWNF